MVEIKNGLSEKDKVKVRNLLNEIRNTKLYDDFYITKNNLRLFIRENLNKVFSDLRKGDVISFSDEAVGLVLGYADKVHRKYVRLMGKDLKACDKVLQVILWNVKSNLFAKVKKNSPLIEVLTKNDFVFFGDRGTEILLGRKCRWSDFEKYSQYYNKKFSLEVEVTK